MGLKVPQKRKNNFKHGVAQASLAETPKDPEMLPAGWHLRINFVRPSYLWPKPAHIWSAMIRADCTFCSSWEKGKSLSISGGFFFSEVTSRGQNITSYREAVYISKNSFDEGDADGGERFLSVSYMTVRCRWPHLESDTVLSCKCCAASVFLEQDKGCRISLVVRCLSVPCWGASGRHRSHVPPPPPVPPQQKNPVYISKKEYFWRVFKMTSGTFKISGKTASKSSQGTGGFPKPRGSHFWGKGSVCVLNPFWGTLEINHPQPNPPDEQVSAIATTIQARLPGGVLPLPCPKLLLQYTTPALQENFLPPAIQRRFTYIKGQGFRPDPH